VTQIEFHTAGEDLPSVLPDWLAAHRPQLNGLQKMQAHASAQSWARVPETTKDAIAAMFVAIAHTPGD
jgi:hypothetical protein